MEIMFSERGKLIYMYQNKFYMKRVLMKCNAQVYTVGEKGKPIFSRKSGNHNHDRDSAAIIRQKLSNSGKRLTTYAIDLQMYSTEKFRKT